MTELDTRFALRLPPIINKYGKNVVIELAPAREYSLSGGRTVESSPIKYTIKCTPPQLAVRGWQDTVLQTGDMEVYTLPNDSIDFRQGRRIQIDSAQWTIETVKPIYSGELIALWGLLLRR